MFEELMFDLPEGEWTAELGNWLTTMRHDAYEFEPAKEGRLPKGYTVATGPSPRGEFLHSVVALDGVPVHDPHPSGAMVKEVFYHLEFLPWDLPPADKQGDSQ